MRKSDKKDAVAIVTRVAVAMALAWMTLFLFSRYARAEPEMIVEVTVCKVSECMDKQLIMEPGTTDIQCLHTALPFITKWMSENLPEWKIERFGCTRHPKHRV